MSNYGYQRPITQRYNPYCSFRQGQNHSNYDNRHQYPWNKQSGRQVNYTGYNQPNIWRDERWFNGPSQHYNQRRNHHDNQRNNYNWRSSYNCRNNYDNRRNHYDNRRSNCGYQRVEREFSPLPRQGSTDKVFHNRHQNHQTLRRDYRYYGDNQCKQNKHSDYNPRPSFYERQGYRRSRVPRWQTDRYHQNGEYQENSDRAYLAELEKIKLHVHNDRARTTNHVNVFLPNGYQNEQIPNSPMRRVVFTVPSLSLLQQSGTSFKSPNKGLRTNKGPVSAKESVHAKEEDKENTSILNESSASDCIVTGYEKPWLDRSAISLNSDLSDDE